MNNFMNSIGHLIPLTAIILGTLLPALIINIIGITLGLLIQVILLNRMKTNE